MTNPMLTTIRRQNQVHATKQVCRYAVGALKVITFGAAIYLCIVAILGFGSL